MVRSFVTLTLFLWQGVTWADRLGEQSLIECRDGLSVTIDQEPIGHYASPYVNIALDESVIDLIARELGLNTADISLSGSHHVAQSGGGSGLIQGSWCGGPGQCVWGVQPKQVILTWSERDAEIFVAGSTGRVAKLDFTECHNLVAW